MRPLHTGPGNRRESPECFNGPVNRFLVFTFAKLHLGRRLRSINSCQNILASHFYCLMPSKASSSTTTSLCSHPLKWHMQVFLECFDIKNGQTFSSHTGQFKLGFLLPSDLIWFDVNKKEILWFCLIYILSQHVNTQLFGSAPSKV